MQWTPARDATALQLWSNGASATEIAAQMGGLSRGAVLGRLHRIGAPKRAQCTTRAHAPAKRVNRRVVIKSKPMTEAPEAVSPLNVPFLDRALNQCRAITDATRGEQRCCGHPIDVTDPQMRGYCVAHRQLFYVQTKKAGRNA